MAARVIPSAGAARLSYDINDSRGLRVYHAGALIMEESDTRRLIGVAIMCASGAWPVLLSTGHRVTVTDTVWLWRLAGACLVAAANMAAARQ